jgi:hypothetical protein
VNGQESRNPCGWVTVLSLCLRKRSVTMNTRNVTRVTNRIRALSYRDRNERRHQAVLNLDKSKNIQIKGNMDVFGRILWIYPNSTYAALQTTFVRVSVLVAKGCPCCRRPSLLPEAVLVPGGRPRCQSSSLLPRDDGIFAFNIIVMPCLRVAYRGRPRGRRGGQSPA